MKTRINQQNQESALLTAPVIAPNSGLFSNLRMHVKSGSSCAMSILYSDEVISNGSATRGLNQTPYKPTSPQFSL